MKKRWIAQFQCVAALALFCLGTATAQEVLPAPGDTIDKSNIEKYQNLFPEFWKDAFVDGFGMIAPLSITVEASEAYLPPNAFLEATKKNNGRYTIDDQGYITGGPYEEIIGYPFPDLSPSTPDFETKLMWNYDYRYQYDDGYNDLIDFNKRRGENVTENLVSQWAIVYQGRLFDDPKPLYHTQNAYRNAMIIRNLAPPVQRNFITMLIRYIDQKASDTTYVYLPSMRRVLRGEAGERSTPIMGSTQAPDDFGVFNGRIPEFTYKFIGERKIVAQVNSKIDVASVKKSYNIDAIPVDPYGWQVRDVYVIDVMPISKKYPQGRKRIWIDKEFMYCLYGCAWDRPGVLWKIWQARFQPCKNQSGEGDIMAISGLIGIDLQIGYGANSYFDWKVNGQNLTEADFSISAIRKLGR